MIESGLALIAACLPTVHYLFARTSPASTRSGMTSVAAARSSRTLLRETPGSEARLANVSLDQSRSAQVEAYAMGAVEPKPAPGGTLPGDEIWVDNTITQGRDMV